MNKKTQKLALSAIMIALATILSFVKVYQMPYGGSITAFSMVPILFIGYLFGIKWGLLTGFVHGIIQTLLGAFISSAFAGLSIKSVILVFFFDFFMAFTCLGLSGIFKGKIKNRTFSIGLGAFVATLMRFIAHFLSGFIVYGSYAEWFFSQSTVSFGEKMMSKFSGTSLAMVYSLIYNGSYMIPEIIISVIGCIVIFNIPPVKKMINKGM